MEVTALGAAAGGGGGGGAGQGPDPPPPPPPPPPSPSCIAVATLSHEPVTTVIPLPAKRGSPSQGPYMLDSLALNTHTHTQPKLASPSPLLALNIVATVHASRRADLWASGT